MATMERIENARPKNLSVYLVREGSLVIGLITKWRDTRTSSPNPWMAYLDVGEGSNLLGSFYPADGGKVAAMNTIVAAKEKRDRADAVWSALSSL